MGRERGGTAGRATCESGAWLAGTGEALLPRKRGVAADLRRLVLNREEGEELTPDKEEYEERYEERDGEEEEDDEGEEVVEEGVRGQAKGEEEDKDDADGDVGRGVFLKRMEAKRGCFFMPLASWWSSSSPPRSSLSLASRNLSRPASFHPPL